MRLISNLESLKVDFSWHNLTVNHIEEPNMILISSRSTTLIRNTQQMIDAASKPEQLDVVEWIWVNKGST